MSAWAWLAVAGVGGLAALARFTVDGAVVRRLGRGFPYATFAVNLTASFLLGLVAGLALSTTAAIIAGSAAVGSYSTFSTWMFETDRLGERGARAAAAVNVVGSLVAGVAAAALGRTIGASL